MLSVNSITSTAALSRRVVLRMLANTIPLIGGMDMLRSASVMGGTDKWDWPKEKPRRWIKLGRPLLEKEIVAFEVRLKERLPASFRKLLTYSNGLKSYDGYDVPFKETQKQFNTTGFTRPTIYGIDHLGTPNSYFQAPRLKPGRVFILKGMKALEIGHAGDPHGNLFLEFATGRIYAYDYLNDTGQFGLYAECIEDLLFGMKQDHMGGI